MSKKLKIPLAEIITKRFPDNELYIRILDDISGEDVIIVQTTYPDQNLHIITQNFMTSMVSL